MLTMLGAGGVGSYAMPSSGLDQILIATGCLALLLLHKLEHQLFSFRVARAMVQTSGPIAWGVLVGLSAWLVVMPKFEMNPFIYFVSL
jgi:hypothetical protein